MLHHPVLHHPGLHHPITQVMSLRVVTSPSARVIMYFPCHRIRQYSSYLGCGHCNTDVHVVSIDNVFPLNHCKQQHTEKPERWLHYVLSTTRNCKLLLRLGGTTSISECKTLCVELKHLAKHIFVYDKHTYK